ncbi:MAG: hypothetical protein K9K64_15015, partial [Desulfohalobiaceae bacterium]|nr:hypothetical protein [Desulfohalobiaceae bacterium]
VANLASLELHVLQSRSVAPDRPTAVVFDLDPGPPAGLIEAAKVGLLLQRVLADIGLASFAKVSGGKGLHCCVPLNTPYDYTQSKEFAKTVAKRIEAHYPELVTSRMNKKYRTGKVFIDWSQNDEHKSTVCAYSLRATPKPYVAAPVSWDEVDLAVQHNQEDALRFTPEQVMDRLAGSGDLLAPVLYRRQRLPGLKPREIEPVRVLNYSEEAASHADIAGGLAEYRGKRRFEVTPEPAGTGGNQDKWRSSFVVQKHSAGRLHYDLRLECDGVLKSWAVPKGPSFDPGQRRLAVRTEDHPLAYAGFEGRIPKGQYGAGQVIVWDRGAYSPAGSPDPDEANVSQALEEGKLEVTLQGAKLQGDFVLVRTGRDQQGKEQWLLIKKKDAVANSQVDPLQAEPYSVLSGLWIEDLEDASGSSCETSP